LAQRAVWWHIRESIPLARPEGLNIKHDISIPVSRIRLALIRRVAARETLVCGW
jgi:hypothetical protein